MKSYNLPSMSFCSKFYEVDLTVVNLTVVVFILSLTAYMVFKLMQSCLPGIGKLNGSGDPFGITRGGSFLYSLNCIFIKILI